MNTTRNATLENANPPQPGQHRGQTTARRRLTRRLGLGVTLLFAAAALAPLALTTAPAHADKALATPTASPGAIATPSVGPGGFRPGATATTTITTTTTISQFQPASIAATPTVAASLNTSGFVVSTSRAGPAVITDLPPGAVPPGSTTSAGPLSPVAPLAPVPSLPAYDPRICSSTTGSTADLCRDENLPGAEPPSAGYVVDVRAQTPAGTSPVVAGASASASPAAAPAPGGETASAAVARAEVTLDRGPGASYATGDSLTITYSVPEPMAVEVALVLADRRLVLYQGTVQGSSTLTTGVPTTPGLAVVEVQARAPDGRTWTATAWFRVV